MNPHTTNLALVIELAMPGIQALPIARRADAFDGISTAWATQDPTLSIKAAQVAESLRRAEQQQLIFQELLNEKGVIPS